MTRRFLSNSRRTAHRSTFRLRWWAGVARARLLTDHRLTAFLVAAIVVVLVSPVRAYADRHTGTGAAVAALAAIYYTLLTRDLVIAGQRQTQDALLPVVAFSLADPHDVRRLRVVAVNVGPGPALNLSLRLVNRELPYEPVPINPAQPFALPAGERVQFDFQLAAGWDGRDRLGSMSDATYVQASYDDVFGNHGVSGTKIEWWREPGTFRLGHLNYRLGRHWIKAPET